MGRVFVFVCPLWLSVRALFRELAEGGATRILDDVPVESERVLHPSLPTVSGGVCWPHEQG